MFWRKKPEPPLPAPQTPWQPFINEMAALIYQKGQKSNPQSDQEAITLLNDTTKYFALNEPTGPSIGRVFFIELLPKNAVAEITAPFLSSKVFASLRQTLCKNFAILSATDYDPFKPMTYPIFPKTEDPLAQAYSYLKNTPLLNAFFKSVPFSIPDRLWNEHCFIAAPSGHGKTQTLQHIISNLIGDNPPAMIVIDSQGEMLRKIENLELFTTTLKDRLVIIDPEDPNPPQLNLFKLGSVHDAAIDDLFQYMFTAIDNTLTPQQATTVTYILRLIQHLPQATLNTLRQVMDDKAKSLEQSQYKDAIAALDPITRDFFANHFFSPGPMAVTRASISRRLFALLANPVFATMFGAIENTFDASQAIREKKIVLVNTSRKSLGDGSSVLGRFFIAQTLAAAYRRTDTDLALLIVDEASEYFDSKTERILSQARKFNLGYVSATQFLDQLPKEVKASIFGNTAIKLAGPVSHSDATALAHEMYTTADFIRSTKKTTTTTEFAAHVRTITPAAVKLSIPFGTLEKQPKMTAEANRAIRKANRERYGTHEGFKAEPSRDSSVPPGLPDAAPSVPQLIVLPQHYPIVILGETHTALLDTGASSSCLPVSNLTVQDGKALFVFNGKHHAVAITKYTNASGVFGRRDNIPVITLVLKVADHTGEEQFLLNDGDDTILIGRTFLAGRILIQSEKRW